MNKAETAAQHGEDQVLVWRRSFSIPPPELTVNHEHYPGQDTRYANLDVSDLPLTECLEDTCLRFQPYWENTISPAIKAGKRVLIAAHGNSLRALVKDLEGLSDEEILQINIPTGLPLVYQLDENLKPTDKFYLGDDEAVKAAMEAVANQGKVK